MHAENPVERLPTAERLSWRDPDGFVLGLGDRILRAIAAEKFSQTNELLRSGWIVELLAEGAMPKTAVLAGPPPPLEDATRWGWLEHEVLDFPCYPHEITALQLYDSGQLTLRLALEAVAQGWELKDASAWNVLHSHGRAVFVDILSFDRMQLTGRWIAYGQFVRHFLLPLLLYRHLGAVPAQSFLGDRDGVTAEAAYASLPVARLAAPLALELVVLPKLLSRSGSRLIASQVAVGSKSFNSEVAKSVVTGTLHRLQRSLARLRPDRFHRRSVWAAYEQQRDHYTSADLDAKRDFVRQHIGDGAAVKTVLDVGCNAGEFSLLAAECGKTVVAADSDHAALMRLYSRVRGTESRITPLLLNIGRPTPAIGWENREVASFIERAAGRFDCIFALGLLHHLLVSERASLRMIADLLDRLNPRRVILEWVSPADPKFRTLAGLNLHLYQDLDTAQLEACFARVFRLAAKFSLPCGTRVMYLWAR